MHTRGYRRTALLNASGAVDPGGTNTIDAMSTAEETGAYSGRTAWARNLQTPLREFVETEIGGAAVLLGAAAAALLWINVDTHSYDSFWSTTLSIDVGDPRGSRSTCGSG